MKNYDFPNNKGYFGEFGGRFVPPALEQVLCRLTAAYNYLKSNKEFQQQLDFLYQEYAGRPSRLYYARNLSDKINNVIGQGLVAKFLKKKKLIAETGAGQHGVATATIAAYFGMNCDIYMGTRDIEAQKPNVYRMKILGAQVIPVTQGQATLKDAIDVALAAYINEPGAYYLLGSAVKPHPYPMMVRDFQKIISIEIKKQILEKENRLPESIIACVGGGSNGLCAFLTLFLTKKSN
jgi:tryptophan synthase beta chain